MAELLKKLFTDERGDWLLLQSTRAASRRSRKGYINLDAVMTVAILSLLGLAIYFLTYRPSACADFIYSLTGITW